MKIINKTISICLTIILIIASIPGDLYALRPLSSKGLNDLKTDLVAIPKSSFAGEQPKGFVGDFSHADSEEADLRRTVEALFNEAKKTIGDERPILSPGTAGACVCYMLRGEDNDGILDGFIHQLREQQHILSQGAEPDAALKENISSIDKFFQIYLKTAGVAYRPLKIIIVPAGVLTEDEIAQHLDFYGVIAISQDKILNNPPARIRRIIRHEGFHYHAYGFGPPKLNEGMTEYLTIEQEMIERGLTDFSHGAMGDFMKRLVEEEANEDGAVATYKEEVGAVQMIADTIGEKMLLDAYFKGDLRALKATGLWEEIEDIDFYTMNPLMYLLRMMEFLRGHRPSSSSLPQARPLTEQNLTTFQKETGIRSAA